MRRVAVAIDSGSVRLFQVIVYTAYVIAGVQSLVLGAPPNAVSQAMGHVAALAWTLLIMACPALSLLGLWRGSWPFSLHLQLAGDSGVAFASAAYVVAVLQATWSEKATFAAWMATSLAVCGVLMVVHDIRRIRLVQRRIGEVDRD